MIFALGFLLASLCALLFLPAVNARAARLARRRMAALFPLTTVEIAAEKDYLRAQFAVERRRLERRLQAVAAEKHADMAAIGVRTLEAAALSRAIEERETTLRAKESEIAEISGQRDRTTLDLEATRSDFALGVATLEVLEEAHRDLLDDLLRTRRRTALVSDQDVRSADIDLQAQVEALAAERDALRASLSEAREALAQGGAEVVNDNAALRASITALADALLWGERLPSVAAFPLPSSGQTASKPALAAGQP